MAKVGLKDTLALLAKGYSKKDIDELAAIDEQNAAAETAKEEEQKTEEKAPEDEKEPEPDYKTMYEDLLKKNRETEAKVTKLQQDNIHENSAPAAAEAKAQEQESLNNLVRSFM